MSQVLLTRKVHFCASVCYHNPDLSEAENAEVFGKGVTQHGHNYILEVTVAGNVDPKTGMVMNLSDLDRIIKAEVMAQLDHKFLNVDVEHFQRINPTSENVIAWLWEQIDPKVEAYGRLQRLRLHEDAFTCVDYYGGVEAPTAIAE